MCRDTDWADEEDVLVLAQEVEAEERLHLAAIDLDRCTPVEAIEDDAIFEASLLEMAFERLVVAPLDLVSEQQRQECRVIELLSACQC